MWIIYKEFKWNSYCCQLLWIPWIDFTVRIIRLIYLLALCRRINMFWTNVHDRVLRRRINMETPISNHRIPSRLRLCIYGPPPFQMHSIIYFQSKRGLSQIKPKQSQHCSQPTNTNNTQILISLVRVPRFGPSGALNPLTLIVI